MAQLNHPSMKVNKPVATSNPKPTNYVVEDASAELKSIDDRMKQFEVSSYQVAETPPVSTPAPATAPVAQPAVVVQPQAEPASAPVARLEPELKKKAESLIFFGKITKSVDIAGHSYELSTLTNKEQDEIIKQLYSLAEAADLFTIRVITLANALKSVDGILLDNADVFEDETEQTFTSKFSRRMTIVENMQLGIIERLYDEYNTLLGESDALIKGDVIKK